MIDDMDDIPEDIKQYVRENGLQFDLAALKSPVLQKVLRLRMLHPEWKQKRLTQQQIQARDWLHW